MVGPGGACVVAWGHVWLLWGACVVAPRGTCMVALGGMHGSSWGGMCGCSGGVCVVAPRGTCVVAWGGHAWFLPGGHAWFLQGGHAWLLPGEACMVSWGGMHGCSQGEVHVWDTMRYGDTINERAVRILLECILVCSVVLEPLRSGGGELASLIKVCCVKQSNITE